MLSCCITVLGKSDSQAGSDSNSKKPLMLRTPNGYKCLTCNRLFSQKGKLDANSQSFWTWQIDLHVHFAFFPPSLVCFRNIETSTHACAYIKAHTPHTHTPTPHTCQDSFIIVLVTEEQRFFGNSSVPSAPTSISIPCCHF